MEAKSIVTVERVDGKTFTFKVSETKEELEKRYRDAFAKADTNESLVLTFEDRDKLLFMSWTDILSLTIEPIPTVEPVEEEEPGLEKYSSAVIQAYGVSLPNLCDCGGTPELFVSNYVDVESLMHEAKLVCPVCHVYASTRGVTAKAAVLETVSLWDSLHH